MHTSKEKLENVGWEGDGRRIVAAVCDIRECEQIQLEMEPSLQHCKVAEQELFPK